MNRFSGKLALVLCAALLWANTSYASVDSYRYLHVTIETPWMIFLVLLPMVLTPLVLMAVLAWRYAERKKEAESQNASQNEAE